MTWLNKHSTGTSFIFIMFDNLVMYFSFGSLFSAIFLIGFLLLNMDILLFLVLDVFVILTSSYCTGCCYVNCLPGFCCVPWGVWFISLYISPSVSLFRCQSWGESCITLFFWSSLGGGEATLFQSIGPEIFFPLSL